MSSRPLRTADYPESSRARLGEAVAEARRAAGHKKRPSFVRATGVTLRSLEAVELAEPIVGGEALEKIGEALGQFHPQWTKDTPRAILEGGSAPAVTVVASPPLTQRRGSREVSPAIAHSPDEPEFWVGLRDLLRDSPETFDQLWSMYQERKRLQRLAERGSTGPVRSPKRLNAGDPT